MTLLNAQRPQAVAKACLRYRHGESGLCNTSVIPSSHTVKMDGASLRSMYEGVDSPLNLEELDSRERETEVYTTSEVLERLKDLGCSRSIGSARRWTIWQTFG